MLACPFGPEWDLLVSKVGKFQATRDYLQNNGEVRTPQQVLDKLVREGVLDTDGKPKQYTEAEVEQKGPQTAEEFFAINPKQSILGVGISEIKDGLAINDENMSNASAFGAIKTFAKNLAGQLNVAGKDMPYQFITAKEAVALTAGKKNPWTGQKAFYLGDTVYFVGEMLSIQDVFHEFAHPFVRSLALSNRPLFDKLYANLLATQEGQELFQQVSQAYPDLDANSDLFAEEMIVRTLTKSADLTAKDLEGSAGFKGFLKDLLYSIKQMLRKMFGQKVSVSKLDANTTIQELANMLKEGKDFMLDPAVLENIDTVAYVTDIQNFLSDIQKIQRPDLMVLTVRAHEIALKQIDTVMRNKNYAEMASILADEFKRGDLQEIKRNLSKFAKPLEDKLLDKRDEIEYNKAHAIAMINTLLRLQKITSKIKDQLKEMSKDKDNVDNMHRTYYYDHLLNYWDKYMDEVMQTISAADVPETSQLSSLVSSIKGTINNTRKYTKEMYKDGVKDVLYNELRPMAENLDQKYKNIIENLKKRGAPAKLIDVYFQEYYGMNQDQHKRWMELKALKNAGTISLNQLKELKSLDVLSMDGAQITDEKIEMALNGEYRDSNVFSSFFEGYLYNTDPVVGGFALYVKNQISDVMNVAMGKFNDYARDMRPLLEAAGYNPSNVNELIEKIARKELIGTLDKDGKFVEKEVWTLKSIHKDWRIALDRLRNDINNAQKEYSETGTKDAHQKLVDAISAKKKFLREYFHQEYDPKVYSREELLEKDEIGKEAAFRRDRIFEMMDEYSDPLTSKLTEFETTEKLEDLWREYRQLYSLVDLNGNLKTGLDLQVALRLKEHRAAAIDPETGESFYEWKLRQGIYENALAQTEQELAIKYGVDSPEYKNAREMWIKKNTRISIKKEFYDKRRQILDAIEQIMESLPDAQRKSSNVSEIWSKILDLTSTNRDEDGQPIGLNFTKEGIAFIKEQQELLQKAMENFAGLSGLTKSEAAELQSYWDVINSKSRVLTQNEKTRFNALLSKSDQTGLGKVQKQKLFGLFAQLEGLQKKEATDYYVLIMNNQLSKLNTTLMLNEMGTNNVTKENADMVLQDHIIDNLLKQSPEFKAWFEANHIRKEKYDKETNTKGMVWERIYAWNVVRPVDEDYYEVLPTMKYYARVVKPQYRTQRIVGVTVDNQGNFLPRTDVADSPFIDQDYLKMAQTDPKHYALLEKMKEHHLKNQEGMGYRNRLYLDIPRFRKNALEVVKTKKLAQIAGGLPKDNAPLLQLMIERFKNFFRKAKDEKGSEYNWEDDAVMMRADMFDSDAVNIPIYGLSDINIEDVSTDVNQSLMRYMFGAERHKKLVEINPVAQALKKTVNDPSYASKELDRINKLNFVHRGVITYLNKKGRYTRQAAVNNFIEREFEGKVDTGWTKDNAFLQNTTNLLLSRASLSFFALNIPSALKNAIGAKWQSMIHAAGGIDVDPTSLIRGEAWAFNTMGQVSFNIYSRDKKPLNMMIIDSFDVIRERAEKKLPQSLSRTFQHDLSNFSWLTNFRTWTSDEATIQLFAGMMYKKKIKMGDQEISYIDAWEQVNEQLKLKDGIDVRYSNLPTEYTVKEGDTYSSLAKQFNMTEEDLKASLNNVTLKEGREIKIDNTLYKAFRNRVHAVTVNLNGAYAKFDQPEAQRYLAFRFISFLKRYFTPMLMNRFGYSGKLNGRKRGRLNYGMADVSEGTYITMLKTMSRTIEFGFQNLPHMTPEEVAAFKKTMVEVISLMVLLSIVAPMLGFDFDDPDRFEKLRERSGNMPFFGLVPEDKDHPWNMDGWVMNHLLALTLQVRAENEAFVPWPGFGLDNYYDTFTDASSISFGPTLKSYKEMVEYLYMDITGDPKGTYAKDAGPYQWQKEGGSKFWTTFWKSAGFSGGTIDPVTAIKNNPSIYSGSSAKKKSREERQND